MISFEGAGKTYTSMITRRRVVALEDFSLQLSPGEVVGIAGPNGAGKSTLISLLLGFLRPTSGSVTLQGRSPRDFIESDGVGYLPELVNLPPRWKVPTLLRRMAVLSGVPASQVSSRVDAVMNSLGLVEHAGKQVRQLSKGNLQRVGLAQALLGEFRVVVLDEPTHGLDPVWTAKFRDVVSGLRSPDRVVLVASHNLDELERIADRVAILNRGRLTRVVDSHVVGASEAEVSWRLVFEGAAPVTRLLPAATPIEGRAGAWRVAANRAQLSSALARLLSEGAVLVECVPESSRLESAFRAAVEP
ncbi:MAG TPA: ABC transporter ATP-binding protein [Gemmatimonadales bacterium]|nr:ABC transporter ATP-binding protein [Gemmatimonadales bacterium]